MKKIAVVLMGWHYPSQPYNSLTQQTLPIGWDAEYFVIGFRDPIHSHNEKSFSKPNNILDQLDLLLYETSVDKEYLNQLGWKYIEFHQGNEWEGANFFLSLYDYKNYDCILFAGDDFLVLNDQLFSNILSSNNSLFINEKSQGKWIPRLEEKTNYEDWLVISNAILPNRQMIRGSFELFKKEIFDIMGGKFPLHLQLKEFSEKNKTNTESLSYMELNEYNTQCLLFISDIVNKYNLYHKFRFLGDNYRISNYIIEGERGYISSNQCGPYINSYIKGINKISNQLY